MNYCDDGGACHHNCVDRSGKCYRRQCCEPLSNVFPNDEWPPPSGAEVHETDPTLSKPTPTPSITVGTQVRLTGVVAEGYEDFSTVLIQDPQGRAATQTVTVPNDTLEVIRQPFKRGEVVYSKISATNEEPYVVLNDESLGMVDVTCCRTGFYIANDNPEAYERRP